MIQCSFCVIEANRLVHEDSIARAFVPSDTIAPGQVLIVPARHVQSITELSIVEIDAVFRLVSLLSGALKSEFGYGGVNIIVNDGVSAGQSVKHLHVHLVPRKLGDVPNPKLWLNGRLFAKLYHPTKTEYKKVVSVYRKRVTELGFSYFEPSQKIEAHVKIGRRVKLGFNIHLHGGTKVADNCTIGDGVILGQPNQMNIKKYKFKPTSIGAGSIIRSGSVIYTGVIIGRNFDCGHNVLVREGTCIGNNVYIMPGTQVHSHVKIGNTVRLSGFIANRTVIEDNASSLGTLIHRYRESRGGLIEKAPVIRKGAIVGMGAIVIGGIEIGENSIVAAGSVVTTDVPPNTVAVGVPAKIVSEASLDLPN